MIQYSTAVRNARLDAVEVATGASPILTIRTGAVPANCAAANSGTVLATINLPVDWMAAASNGSKSMLGSWVDTAADAAGTAAHFRIHDNTGTVCHLQGTITATAGGGDMTVDNTSLATGQSFAVTAFSITAGSA